MYSISENTMIFLTQKEIEEGVQALSSIISINLDESTGDILLSHLHDLISIQANSALILASSKFYYLKLKSNAENSAMYTYCTELNDALSKKISSYQSILKRETTAQFINNKNI